MLKKEFALYLLAAGILGCVVAASAQQRCFPEVSCKYTEPPATQTIASGGTIAADACGSVKNLSADGAVTTDTTNTFDAPSGSNKGCWMVVCNQSANTITLDSNANFPGVSGADVPLTQLDCLVVVQTGTQWFAASGLVSNN